MNYRSNSLSSSESSSSDENDYPNNLRSRQGKTVRKRRPIRRRPSSSDSSSSSSSSDSSSSSSMQSERRKKNTKIKEEEEKIDLNAIQNIEVCKSPRKILESMMNELQELFLCPIMNTDMNNPVILPSGNTIDKKSARRLKGKRDPYDRTNKIRKIIPNRFAIQVKEIVEMTQKKLAVYDNLNNMLNQN